MKNRLLIFIFCSAVSLHAQNETWHQLSSQKIGPVFSLTVTSRGIIFASVFEHGIFRSSDSGATWVQTAPSAGKTYSLVKNSSDDIFAAEWNSGIFSSTNNGEHWNALSSSLSHVDIRAVNSAGMLFAESEGVLFSSADYGKRWKSLHSFGGAVVALPNKEMYAAKGDSLLRSTNNGLTWTHFASFSSPVYSLYADTSGILFAGMYSDENEPVSGIFKWKKSESFWKQTGPQTTINQIIQYSPGKYFAATADSGCYVSIDSGVTWKPANTGLTSAKIYSLALLPDGSILLGTVDGIFSNIQRPDFIQKNKNNVPSEFRLEQNFPNPFNPATVISYQFPVSGFVSLKVFDTLGREAALLVNETQPAGRYSVRWNAEAFSSGIYIYQLKTAEQVLTKKMILTK